MFAVCYMIKKNLHWWKMMNVNFHFLLQWKIWETILLSFQLFYLVGRLYNLTKNQNVLDIFISSNFMAQTESMCSKKFNVFIHELGGLFLKSPPNFQSHFYFIYV